MLFDTHTHLNFKDFDRDVDKLIKKTLEAGVWLINVGTNYLSSERAVKLASHHKQGVYAAVGLHPMNIKQDSFVKSASFKRPEDILEEDFDFEKYKELAKEQNVLAIGEIGLDYWRKPKTKKKLNSFKERQINIFLKQVELAKELNLPLIVHCRAAHSDLVSLLTTNPTFQEIKLRGVIHSFTGSWEEAKKYLELGFYLGFNGIIFKLDLKEIIQNTPLERILIETDAPFLIPPQVSFLRRNEPLFVKYVAQEIAKIKKQSFEKIAEITTENAKKLFNL